MESKLNILVTGSAGFIGATFCHEVLKLNHKVLGIDNYSNSSKLSTDNLKFHHKNNFTFLELDLAESNKELSQELESFKPDLVLHFAALKSVRVGESDPDLYWKNNLDSTLNLLHAAKESGCKKIIFSSSAAVYSKSNLQPVSEDSDLEAESVYGETKLACENIIKDFCEENFMDAVIFRYFNVSGCHKNRLFFETNKTSENLMINLIDVAKGNANEIAIFGDNYNTKDGSATRDYIHIEDLLDAHIKIIDLLKEIKGCEIFNLGSGVETSVLQLLNIYEQSNGVKINYKISNRRPGDLPSSFSNPYKFNIFSNWKTQKNLRDICIDSWNSNKD